MGIERGVIRRYIIGGSIHNTALTTYKTAEQQPDVPGTAAGGNAGITLHIGPVTTQKNGVIYTESNNEPECIIFVRQLKKSVGSRADKFLLRPQSAQTTSVRRLVRQPSE